MTYKEPPSFAVHRRNFGHWDITSPGIGRIFAIRGGPGAYYIRDERDNHGHKEPVSCKTLQACMSHICDELMFELLIAEGQAPHVIEAWNIPEALRHE